MFSNEDVDNVIKVRAEIYARNIEKYALSCGPAVISRVKGISRLDAAILLSDIDMPTGDWTYTKTLTIAKACGRESKTAHNKDHVSLSDRFPTMSKWLSENRTRIAILRVDHHFAYVGFTYVLETNGWENMGGKVSHVIYLD